MIVSVAYSIGIMYVFVSFVYTVLISYSIKDKSGDSFINVCDSQLSMGVSG